MAIARTTKDLVWKRVKWRREKAEWEEWKKLHPLPVYEAASIESFVAYAAKIMTDARDRELEYRLSSLSKPADSEIS